MLFYLRSFLFYFILWFGKMLPIYREVVLNNGSPKKTRQNIEQLLRVLNTENNFFRNTFSDFLKMVADQNDEFFFDAFAKLPPLSKDDYLKAGKDIITGKEKPKLDLPSFFGGLKNLRKDWSFSMMTGGSSKKPLRVYMDKYHATRMAFSFFKCWYLMGWRPGHKMILIYPKGVYDLDLFEKFNTISHLTGCRVFFFEDERDTLKQIAKTIDSYRPDLIITFPSSLNRMARALNRGDIFIDNHPKMINVSGETFLDCQKTNCQNAFPQTLIEDSYGSVELGEIAHETSYGLEVFSNFAYAETIPSSHGKEEIIVTIHDHAYFPFIKYKMGDILTLKNGFISDIEGKSTNHIEIGGLTIYPRDIDEFIKSLNLPITDVQLVIDTKITLKAISYENCESEIRSGFLKEFGLDVDVHIVREIQHDYKKKYRVIKDVRQEDEFAGGVIDKL